MEIFTWHRFCDSGFGIDCWYSLHWTPPKRHDGYYWSSHPDPQNQLVAEVWPIVPAASPLCRCSSWGRSTSNFFRTENSTTKEFYDSTKWLTLEEVQQKLITLTLNEFPDSIFDVSCQFFSGLLRSYSSTDVSLEIVDIFLICYFFLPRTHSSAIKFSDCNWKITINVCCCFWSI